MTALLVLAVPILPLPGLLALLPLLGVALNGTSTVLYGTVPETARGDIGHAFALFYTGVIGAGALAPIGYGALADATGRQAALVAVADCAGDDPARFRARETARCKRDLANRRRFGYLTFRRAR